MSISDNDAEEHCPRCDMPRSVWAENGRGYPRAERIYCCRGCADATGCTCLEAGAAA
jgi:hypothetical protein